MSRSSLPVTASMSSFVSVTKSEAVSTRSLTSFSHAASNGITIGMVSISGADDDFVYRATFCSDAVDCSPCADDVDLETVIKFVNKRRVGIREHQSHAAVCGV